MAQDLITATLKPGITEGISLYKNQSAELNLASYVDLKRITGETINYPFSGSPSSQDGGVLAGKTVTKISSGNYHTLLLNTDGSLAAFGQNDTGQLGASVEGVGDWQSTNAPIEPSSSGALSLENITRIKCHNANSIFSSSWALSEDGDFIGWGYTQSRGSSNPTNYRIIPGYGWYLQYPSNDSKNPILIQTGVLDFAIAGIANGGNKVIRKESGLFYSSYTNAFESFSPSSLTAISGKTITQLEGYSNIILALCSDNTIFANGGGGSAWTSLSLNGALTGKTVIRLVGGYDRIFAFCSDGTVAGLGSNTYGKLGNGNAIGQTAWAAVSLTGALSGKTITDVSVGTDHTLFLCLDGTVAAVGRNAVGQLGNGTTLNSTSAVKVFAGGHLNGKTPIAISAGGYHSAVVTSDGSVFTWGLDNYGQLGNGLPLSNTSIPVPVLKDSFTKYQNHVRFTSSNLPDGLSFDGNLVQTAKIIGTPTATGTTNALIKVDLSDFTLYNPIPESGNIYETEGTTYLTVPFVVEDPPTTLPPSFSNIIANEDINIRLSEAISIPLTVKEGQLYEATWRVTQPPPGMELVNGNTIAGAPDVLGEYDVTVSLNYRTGWGQPLQSDTKTITITVSQGVPDINLSHLNSTWNGQVNVLNTSAQQGKAFSLQINASNSPESFAATGMPPGLSISNSGLISGTPSTPGTYLIGLSATNDIGTSATKNLRMDVTEITAPTFLNNGGVDVFFDLQTRKLSLTPPKPEATVAAGSQVVNKLEASNLIVKTGETLWLNLRFTKGTTPLDPEATGLRFGVAGKVGGPLLMEGSEFTKFGVGAGAYYRMRVTSIENEFGAIIDDYYDDDSVEQISDAKEKEASASGEIQGLCEVVLTTGSGATIADLKSDTLGVTLKRSLFSA